MNAHSNIVFGGHSDIGLVRKENQDAYGAFPEGDDSGNWQGARLFLVADGMGGHSGGGEASRLAVRIIGEQFLSSNGAQVSELLQSAFQQANGAIYRESCKKFPPTIMGSTCVALAITPDSACIAHVGDSRAYRINRSGIQQMTEDHSVVGEMMRRGMLPKEKAASHPDRSQITRALGAKPNVEVDIVEGIVLGESDSFLLCTDGLSNAVTEAEMRDTVLSLQAREASKALVDLAVSRGGEDNVTAQVVQLGRLTATGGRLHELFRRGAH